MKLPRFIRHFGTFLKDLFYNTDNEHADLPRILAFSAIVAEFVGEWHNIKLKQPLDLGPGGLGGGLAAILTAAAAYLAAKAWSKKKSRESAAIAQNVAVAKDAGEPVVPTEPAKP